MILIIGLFIVFILLFNYAVFKISSDLSKMEEEE